MVRLERFKSETLYAPIAHFNSIMVRLEHTNLDTMLLAIIFQFHYGAIGTRLQKEYLQVLSIISIPLWCDWNIKPISYRKLLDLISIPLWCDWNYILKSETNETLIYFNSIMVRLELLLKQHLLNLEIIFQFHYGAIGTLDRPN